MEFKKKTIIWEDNNEPPKDYIWIKSDGKAYEFDYNDRKWKESTSINVNNNSSDDGGDGGGSGSMSMYDIWMKAFDGFKVVQDNGTSYLNVAPALVVLNDFIAEDRTNDTYIPLTFMNSQKKKYKEYIGTFEENFIDIKNVPDDIYERIIDKYTNTPYCRFLYDLDELNEKAQNIDTGIDCLEINGGYYSGQTQLKCGHTLYIPETITCLIKINDKFYVWFPNSMD